MWSAERNLGLVLMVTAVLRLSLAEAQVSEAKLTPSDAQEGDGFGMAVGVSGGCLVVGAPQSDEFGSQSGSAYVFERVGETWTEKQKLLPYDGDYGARFGYSAAINGDEIIVGANTDSEIGIDAGAAYDIRLDPMYGQWLHEGKILPSDGEAGDFFGSSVAMDGRYALIGATEADDGAGSVYIFRHVEGGGWIEEDELTGSGGVGDAFFGLSVSLSGDYAIIGAPYDDEMGNRSGAAYIFHLDGGQWTQQARIQSSDIAAGDRFGWSVSISGDYAIVAALYGRGPENSTGAAYIFERNDTTWTEQAKIVDSTAIISACFGYSVSIDGNYAVVAESQDDDHGNLSGSAFLYRRERAEWREVTKLLASDGMESARFGWSIFMQGDEVLVGAPVQDAGGFLTGAAYVYTDFPTSTLEDELEHDLPSLFLERNRPNPFRRSTVISFSLSTSSQALLSVYDATGRLVRTLIDRTCEPGFHQVNWDGRDVAGQEVASGVYFCRLQTEGQAVTKKMMLLR